MRSGGGQYEGAYSDLQGAQSYFGDFTAVSETRIRKLKSFVADPKRVRFLDVGCGIGAHLELARRHFGEVIGIEPSDNAHIARAKGFRVIKDVIRSDLEFFGPSAEVFGCFQVLEHIIHPVKFLRALGGYLSEDAVGCVNVPDGETIFREGIYSAVFSEHTNYFTVQSLIKVLSQSGFEVLELSRDSRVTEIDAFVRKTSGVHTFPSLSLQYRRDVTRLRNQILGSKRVGLWGAGQKAAYFAEVFRDLPLTHLFDSDVSKRGQYVDGISLQIETPSTATVQSCDAILIIAPTYAKSISQSLSDSFGFRGKIVSL